MVLPTAPIGLGNIQKKASAKFAAIRNMRARVRFDVESLSHDFDDTQRIPGQRDAPPSD